MQRRGSVRPEQPERTVTMSFSIGRTESQPRLNRAADTPPQTPSDTGSARPPAAGCPGEREGWWHRRTLSWRTSSGVRVVSRSDAAACVFLGGVEWGERLGPGLCWSTACVCAPTRRNTLRDFISVRVRADGVHTC